LIRMELCVVLVVGLSRVESLQGHNLGNDGARKYSSLVELRNVSLGNVFLLVVGVEN